MAARAPAENAPRRAARAARAPPLNARAPRLATRPPRIRSSFRRRRRGCGGRCHASAPSLRVLEIARARRSAGSPPAPAAPGSLSTAWTGAPMLWTARLHRHRATRNRRCARHRASGRTPPRARASSCEPFLEQFGAAPGAIEVDEIRCRPRRADGAIDSIGECLWRQSVVLNHRRGAALAEQPGAQRLLRFTTGGEGHEDGAYARLQRLRDGVVAGLADRER